MGEMFAVAFIVVILGIILLLSIILYASTFGKKWASSEVLIIECENNQSDCKIIANSTSITEISPPRSVYPLKVPPGQSGM